MENMSYLIALSDYRGDGWVIVAIYWTVILVIVVTVAVIVTLVVGFATVLVRRLLRRLKNALSKPKSDDKNPPVYQHRDRRQ